MTQNEKHSMAGDVGCILLAVCAFLFFVGLCVAILALPLVVLAKWVVS